MGLALCIVCILIGLACGGGFIIFARKDPHRPGNGFLGCVAVLALIIGICPLVMGYLEFAAVIEFFLFRIVPPVCMLLGLLLIYDAVFLFAKHRLGNHPATTLIAGIAISVLYGALATGRLSTLSWGLPAGFSLFLTLAGAFFTIAFFFELVSAIAAAVAKPRYDYSYVIVLGGGLKDGCEVTRLLAARLDKGIEWLDREGQGEPDKRKIIVSGGQGVDEKVSEAAAMRDYLLASGVSYSRIILEDESTSTLENLYFSQKRIEMDSAEHFSSAADGNERVDPLEDDFPRSVVVTNDFHALRTETIARNCHFPYRCVASCKTPLHYLPAAFMREFAAIELIHGKGVIAYLVVCAAVAALFAALGISVG